MPTSQTSKPALSGARPDGASRLILFATVFFDLLGFGIVIPFLPMYAALACFGLFYLLAARLLVKKQER